VSLISQNESPSVCRVISQYLLGFLFPSPIGLFLFYCLMALEPSKLTPQTAKLVHETHDLTVMSSSYGILQIISFREHKKSKVFNCKCKLPCQTFMCHLDEVKYYSVKLIRLLAACDKCILNLNLQHQYSPQHTYVHRLFPSILYKIKIMIMYKCLPSIHKS
jgi:hypothetical protein